jgi:hypothetical protein
VSSREEFDRRCDAIEAAYEFMLAYAAQGLPGDAAHQTSGQLRELLTRAAGSLAGLGDLFASLVEDGVVAPAAAARAYGEVLDRDARASLAAVELVLAQPAISSQLIDNLNASIHLRALLTDLFLLDELVKGSAD